MDLRDYSDPILGLYTRLLVYISYLRIQDPWSSDIYFVVIMNAFHILLSWKDKQLADDCENGGKFRKLSYKAKHLEINVNVF